MKIGTRHLIRTKKQVRTVEDALPDSQITPWLDWIAHSERQSMMRRGMRAAQLGSEERAARIEQLQAQVQAGTYTINSRVLAERLLTNETHLMDEQER
ncbi:MAG TPA: flagellar biosynthesis anti-sigma factor FlgM [Ktedonosporobacter sp.]|jgi:anti-sigma28 factor (negative regulator of flagellin synthesis)|nr:flagellar biosynthesis anti-sigma factor FlgM [Ktedonosporobacter sp.]